MKFFFSEVKQDYKGYVFPYVVWAMPESVDEIVELYSRGFLPSRKPIFYLARSTRVVLGDFELGYRSRRTIKVCQDVKMSLFNIDDFVLTNAINKMCLLCAALRFGEGVVDNDRLHRIFNKDNASHVMVFSIESEVVGVVAVSCVRKIVKYGFAFYDIDKPQKSLGTFMMTAVINYFKALNYSHVYLGTCCEKRFIYKSKFKGFEFYNGFRWSRNIDELEYLLCRNSDGHLLEAEDYLRDFYADGFDFERFGQEVKYI
ncbi:hypothetical protein DCO48_02960 [Pseudomonas sp. SDI]|uniref:hypothetical protein n=1 Tax=Pseudomonas sp. SDI TaxID=2170734 RepID=UPI000DE72BFB|nr:hypothetical protein [Pseudomonas sp. SDI]PWB35395.1 hypothetical protein DCO48_02960 [Pseudomonas sp. SDI]